MKLKYIILFILIILLLIACSHENTSLDLDKELRCQGYIRTDYTEEEILNEYSNVHECIQYNKKFYCY